MDRDEDIIVTGMLIGVFFQLGDVVGSGEWVGILDELASEVWVWS